MYCRSTGEAGLRNHLCGWTGHSHGDKGVDLVARALKHQGLWLTLTYVGLILLMARVYA